MWVHEWVSISGEPDPGVSAAAMHFSLLWSACCEHFITHSHHTAVRPAAPKTHTHTHTGEHSVTAFITESYCWDEDQRHHGAHLRHKRNLTL